MEVTYHKHKNRRRRKVEMMIRVATDYNGGMSAIEIAQRYGISRPWVYKLLQEAQKPL